MANATLDLLNDTLAMQVRDDDFRVVSLWLPFDPTDDAWSWLVRPRYNTEPLREWDVDTPGTTRTVTRDGEEVTQYLLTADIDTADYGEGGFLHCLFRQETGGDWLPYISGALTVVSVVQRAAS